jgi:N-acetylglutamate synthase/N-acetylornithine aminotransferase
MRMRERVHCGALRCWNFSLLFVADKAHRKSSKASRYIVYPGDLTVALVQVDGDSSTNDTLLALASGAAGGPRISNINSAEARQLQAALDAVSPANSRANFLVPYSHRELLLV